jgi:dynein heavy chain, axonemal
MKAQVSIRLPAALSKNGDEGNPSSPTTRGSRRGAEQTDNKWARARTTKPNLQDRQDLAKTVGSKSMSERSRIDAKNLPYAWRDKHAKEEAEVAAHNRKQKYKREPVRKFPTFMKRPASRTLGGTQIIRESESMPVLLPPQQSLETLINRNSSTPYLNTRPKIAAQSPLGSIVPGKNLDELAEIPSRNESGDPKVDNPNLPWGDVVPDFLRLNESQMPLEMFDNEELELRTPEEWLQHVQTGKSPYYFSGQWSWRSVNVLGYSNGTQRYHVQFKGVNKTEKHVKRLDLMFDGENRTEFVERVAAARAYRERFKEALRLRHYLENVYQGDMSQIADKWVSSIHSRSTVRIKAGVDSPLIEPLTKTFIRRYDTSMAKAACRHRIKNLNDKQLIAQYESMRLPVIEEPDSPPKFGKVQIPSHKFKVNLKTIIKTHHIMEDSLFRIYNFLNDTWHEKMKSCQLVLTKFENAPFVTPAELGDIIKVQTDHTKEMQEFLVADWRQRTLSKIIDDFPSIQGIDLYVAPMDAFLSSRLNVLLRSIELRMSDQLRQLVEKSCEEWLQYTNTQSQEGGGIIKLGLKFVGNRVAFSPSIPEIEEGLLGALSNLEKLVESVKSLLSQEMLVMLHFKDRCVVHDSIIDNIIYSVINRAKETLLQNLQNQFEGPKALAEKFAKYGEYMSVDPEKFWNSWEKYKVEVPRPEDADEDYTPVYEKKVRTLDEYRDEIIKFYGLSDELNIVCYDTETFGIFQVDTEELKKQAGQHTRNITYALMNRLIRKAIGDSEQVNSEYQTIIEKVSSIPTDEDGLEELRSYCKNIDAMLLVLIRKTRGIHKSIACQQDIFQNLTSTQFQTLWEPRKYPKLIKELVDDSLAQLEYQKTIMIEKLEKEKAKFEATIDNYGGLLDKFKTMSDMDNMSYIVGQVDNLVNTLSQADEKAAELNERAAAFGWDPVEYHLLKKIATDFEPIRKLWTMFSDFRNGEQQWLNESFLALNGPQIMESVDTWWAQSYRLKKQMDSSLPELAEVAAKLRSETTAFKEKLPLVEALGHEAMKAPHWVQLADETGKEITPDEFLTLQSMLEMNLMENFDIVQKVSVIATKENALLKKLKSMMGEWGEMVFETKAYRNTGTFVIGGTDDVLTLMDDQIVMLQAMLGSPFIKNIQKDTQIFEKKLQYGVELTEEWLKVQRTWMYLEPIFSSDDIMRQMPKEARRFKSVDSTWRKIMEATKSEPMVMSVIGDDKRKKKFKDCNDLLDLIQKGLEDYLEIKRLSFPRFFFLSNDELLEILSQTKDPRAVQPFLGKCYEGVNKVVFRGETTGQPEDVTITHMVSAEKEKVEMCETINPNEGKLRGNVEMWLNELQRIMRWTMKDIVIRSLKDYTETPRTEWVLKWPGQVVLNVGQVFWTQDVTEGFKTKGVEGIKEYLEVLNEQLNGIVQLVRGKLTKMGKKTLGALCVIDVHSRDVVADMVKAGCNRPDDFEWMAQLRYYWENHPDAYNRYGDNPMNMMARIIQAELMYGYEYIGNSGRLVITPLTDRCFRTLAGAVSLMYGGAPAGPAGTGKTESVKDLSKNLAIQCVVMNCSDGLDYLAMAKFFKGLASAGAWACFDEFNRINLEVLSVIAQQILEIQFAKRTKKVTFTFSGTTLTLNPDCNVFITMNPGYAGRSDLPDNLQALFRPCAMMVPDYAIISNVMLYSFGFQNAGPLARKLTQVLILSSELLSTQKHYDYGMRAVFAILMRAGFLRSLHGDNWSEDRIVLSAMIDVNLPKFTSNDIPLFKGITSDLFPGITVPEPDYKALIPTIKEKCLKNKLQTSENFVKSVVQLYETIMVRHGLVVVGATYSGKTCNIRVLAEAMTEIKDDEDFESDVNIIAMNPKSITSGQLYGNFDENTHEWSDGILAVKFRNASRDTSITRHWVVFDGPVDAVWIENMNTVLDNNKKLCLVSGEIIKMTDWMTMVYEPEDLEEASPATVSRLGVVYMEPSRLGWRTLLKSWLLDIPEAIVDFKDLVTELFEWLLEPLMFFMREECKIPTPISMMEMVNNSLKLLQCFLDEPYGEREGHNPPKSKDASKIIEGYTILSLIWGIGMVTDADGRKTFDSRMRQLLMGTIKEEKIWKLFTVKTPSYKSFEDVANEKASNILIPESGLVYDYMFMYSSGKWSLWTSLAKKFQVPSGATYEAIVVPSLDTIRNAHVWKMLVEHNKHVLVVGDTGTGKSVSMKQLLVEDLDEEKFQPIFLNFSAQTSANMTQDIIDGKLGKRRKGVYGPPLGQRKVVFVDDLNMPAKEEYGAQPPIEILRQWMDHEGWYDLKEIGDFRKLIDIQFVGAMGHPGGGRTRITQRYIRHFNLINCVPFPSSSLQKIFVTLTDWFLRKNDFNNSICKQSENVVLATIHIYNKISAELLPTPAKAHYTFNLRDLSKVFQGMNSAYAGSIKAVEDFARLWVHECLRIFSDRLINKDDKEWFIKQLEETSSTFLKKKWRDIAPPGKNILFGTYGDPTVLVESRLYQEIVDETKLIESMNEYLEDFNQTTKGTQMNLVLFMNAIEHVSRISRVINLPMGNALLVGVGGSGRKSLCTLATSLNEMDLFQIEITKTYNMFDWREDLKTVLRKAGETGKPTVFLFGDTQIKNPTFVEDINNLLNTGEVPNIFLSDEKSAILETLSPIVQNMGLNPTPAVVMQIFVDRVRANLHIVLAFSPIGDAFRTRLRMFPSLVNCCTIDWFTDWPEDALLSVAQHFLGSVSLDDEIKHGVITTCVDMQERVTKMTKRMTQELGRYYYVTPTSYLELINTFKNLFGEKRNEVSKKKARYQNGLTKLLQTAEQVDGMKEELTALQPKLIEAGKETAKKLIDVEKAQKKATAKEKVIAVDEKEAGEVAAAANELKTNCEAILAEAIPALKAATAALNTLKKSHIDEVKALKKPPAAVKTTLTAVAIMLGKKGKRIKNPNGPGKIMDYWEVIVKELLGDFQFINNLKKFDKDNVPQETIDQVIKYRDDPDFTAEKISRSSLACGGLCKWVLAIIKYDQVAKIVAPKRLQLADAQGKLAAANEKLAVKQAELKEVQDLVDGLQKELQETLEKKKKLERDVENCKNKLDRASRLIGGLGGERIRWTQNVENLQIQYDNITGDILLSSGVVAYLGVFNAAYRSEAVQHWSEQLTAKGITCAETFSLSECLGEPVVIRDWIIAKLPNDSFSIDNAIMLQKSKRWPLMIDPQKQANKWIRNKEAPRGIKVVKQSQQNFVRTIENAIQFGTPILLENLPEVIDPILEPLLQRAIISLGGVKTIMIGDNAVPYEDSFQFYMTTTMPNPHFPPETCVKVNLLNFVATVEGLEDQLMGVTVSQERPDLEKQSEELVMQDANNKRQLKEIEDTILKLLAEAEGDILEDEELINVLQESNVTSKQIGKAVEKAKRVKKKVDDARRAYTSIASRVANLFFCISALSQIDPMYQYSLEWYIGLYLLAINKAEKGNNLSERLHELTETFARVLYRNVCRSLFEKDKLLFSFLMTIKVLETTDRMDSSELRYLLAGNPAMDLTRPNPTALLDDPWLNDKSWNNILGLDTLEAFPSFSTQFEDDLSVWHEIYMSTDPVQRMENMFANKTSFQKIILLNTFMPDKVIPEIRKYIMAQIGEEFVDPPPFDLDACYEDSNSVTPLLFVLTPGADPMSELVKVADKKGMSGKRLFSISLGQGQGPLAEAGIKQAIDKGTWVCLENCHLAESWLPTLEAICENMTPDTTHDNFRLWLSSMPSPKFPVSVLQNGVKMTIEPPKGIRNNVQGSLLIFTEEWFESSTKPAAFKKLVFGLCMFHAMVVERCQFGPLGWNIPYTFSIPDLRITLDQLKLLLDEYEEVPWSMFCYCTAECNYGGRVTDAKDRRTINAIITDFYTPEILDDAYRFSRSGKFYVPPEGPLTDYFDFIKTLPFEANPELFGMHDNAAITSQVAETTNLLNTVLGLQAKSGGGEGKTWDEMLEDVAKDIEGRLPQEFDIEKTRVLYPVRFEESMNTVLTEELLKFNRLLRRMATSLKDVRKALKGLVVMSQELEDMGNSMVNGWVPKNWTAVSYPSMKPLGPWTTDFLARVTFFADWVENDRPVVYWISGFFFTPSFMTGTLQNYARKYTVAIDELGTEFELYTPDDQAKITERPADGAYIRGLFLEGAGWDAQELKLVDSNPKQLYVLMPVIWFKPLKSQDIVKGHRYECPVYKTSERRGMLSTSGHSTNYVTSIKLQMLAQHEEKYWIKAGVAMLTQTDD